MTQEVNRAEILGEHVGNIVLFRDVVGFDHTQLNLFPDIVISDLYMFDTLLCYWVLSSLRCYNYISMLAIDPTYFINAYGQNSTSQKLVGAVVGARAG